MLLSLPLGWAPLRGRSLMVKLSDDRASFLQVRRDDLSRSPGSAPSSAGCRAGSSRHWVWEPGLPARRGGVRLWLVETRPSVTAGATRMEAAMAQRASGVTGG